MIAQQEIVVRLLAAALLGSLIGFERERLLWSAGIRTHMLVSVGACLLMIVSAYGFQNATQMPHVILDPSRIAAQVVSGIGFLGAGSILLRGEVIRGLTTAASLWAVAALGLAIGGGLYVEAVAATLIILFILAGLKPLEKRYFQPRRRHQIRLHVAHDTLHFDDLRRVLGERVSRVKQFLVRPSAESLAFDEITIVLARISQAEYSAILGTLKKLSGVRDVKEGDL